MVFKHDPNSTYHSPFNWEPRCDDSCVSHHYKRYSTGSLNVSAQLDELKNHAWESSDTKDRHSYGGPYDVADLVQDIPVDNSTIPNATPVIANGRVRSSSVDRILQFDGNGADAEYPIQHAVT